MAFTPTRNAGGFTYIGVLFLVAFMGVALSAAGTVWTQTRQREKEQELLFVGNQFRQAITSYYEATPTAVKQFPKKLEDLLRDDRFPNIRRHLRHIFRDPMGGAQWGLIRDAGGAIIGVYSTSDGAPLKISNFDAPDRAFENRRHYYEWRFVSPKGIAAAPAPLFAPAAEMPVGTLSVAMPAAPQQSPAAATPGSPPDEPLAEDLRRAQCETSFQRARTLCFATARHGGVSSAAGCLQTASAQYASCLR